MKYYHPVTGRVAAAHNARARFFFLGPFYLLWLQLWQDAIASAVLIVGTVHGSMIAVAAVAGLEGGPNVQTVLRAFNAVQAAADRGVSADAAFRELIAASLPFYAAAIVLLLVMGVLTYVAPTYLRWRFRRMGMIELVDEETEVVAGSGDE